MSIPTYLTVADLAERLQLHPDTIRQEIAEGKLPAFKIGGYRIDPLDAERWIESRRVTAAAPRPVVLSRGNTQESRFAQVARQVEGRGRGAQAADLQLKGAS